jgi:hypothetical protein
MERVIAATAASMPSARAQSTVPALNTVPLPRVLEKALDARALHPRPVFVVSEAAHQRVVREIDLAVVQVQIGADVDCDPGSREPTQRGEIPVRERLTR